MATKHPAFDIRIEALPIEGESETGPFRRLRSFLKSAIRSWGLRAVSIKPASDAGSLVHPGLEPEAATALQDTDLRTLPPAGAAPSEARRARTRIISRISVVRIVSAEVAGPMVNLTLRDAAGGEHVAMLDSVALVGYRRTQEALAAKGFDFIDPCFVTTARSKRVWNGFASKLLEKAYAKARAGGAAQSPADESGDSP